MVRIGFIGTGRFAVEHAEVLQKMDIAITACYGTNPEKTKLFSNKFQCRIYDDPFALISRDVIDVLYIVIPPFAHNGEIELAAAANKIPFFCEKPVGLDLSVCKKVVTQIENTKLITSCGYLLRYEKLFDEVKKIINRNFLSTVRIYSYSYMPTVSWWKRMELSGGMMVESGSHYVDLLRYLMGEITSVSAVFSQGCANSKIENCNIYDSMESNIKFQTGSIGSIGVSHLLNEINARNDKLEVYGDNFSLSVNLYKLRYQNEGIVKYKENFDENWNVLSCKTSKHHLLESESAAFLSAVIHNDQSLIRSTYLDGVKTLEVCLAMNHSAQSQQFLTV